MQETASEFVDTELKLRELRKQAKSLAETKTTLTDKLIELMQTANVESIQAGSFNIIMTKSKQLSSVNKEHIENVLEEIYRTGNFSGSDSKEKASQAASTIFEKREASEKMDIKLKNVR